VACAAAAATIQVLRDEGLIENAAAIGPTLLAGLRQLQEEYPEIGEVRGRGLMLATEFTDPSGEPWTDRAKAIVRAAFEEGLLLLTCGTYDNIIRWIPPLIIKVDHIQEALQRFRAAMRRVA
jgi:4-aminobutyrate aminotransferase